MKTKFLWIEDNATNDLVELLSPIYMDGRFAPVIATTVAEGIYRMKESEYAAVVVDIRLPPGNDREWETLYKRLGGEKGTARLGLHLLYSLFDHREGEDVEIKDKPAWIKEVPRRFGVLTVEDLHGELDETLTSFRITVREQKTTLTPDTMLLTMVERILDGRISGGA
jgi:hypothetical protein